MRYTPLLLFLPLLAACEDALGPAGGCQREMRETQDTFGKDFTRASSGNDGSVYWETWVYPPRGDNPGRTFTFRWGTSMSCEVIPGSVNSLIPSRSIDL